MPKIVQIALIVTVTAAIAVLATAAVMGAQRAADRTEEGTPAAMPPVRIGDASTLGEQAAAEAVAAAFAAVSNTDPKEEASQAAHGDTLLPKKLWENFAGRFITPEGRVVDDANSSISHSEGQGYGMLLAAFAGDEAVFRRLWAWTETELLVRDDGLAAWRWEPDADPHVTDLNNATDGDIL
ncbi:MAG: glycosyl hydrolase family 8, partial [Propylenella sp.]